MTCAEFVALATEYLDGTLDPEATARFATHPGECAGCATYLDQLRTTVALLGQHGRSLGLSRIRPIV